MLIREIQTEAGKQEREIAVLFAADGEYEYRYCLINDVRLARCRSLSVLEETGKREIISRLDGI